jgi:hypothetical protein
LRLGMLLFFTYAILHNTYAAERINPLDFLRASGFSQHDIEQLSQQRWISHAVPESTAREFAMGLALYLPVEPQRVIDRLQRGEWFAVDEDVGDYGILAEPIKPGELNRFKFSAKQDDEVRALLQAVPGDQFNLSQEEIARFAALNASAQIVSAEETAELVSRQYRELMLARWQAYKQHGTHGVADYMRSEGAQISVAEELQGAIGSCGKLHPIDPELFLYWQHYPKHKARNIREQFLWLNRRVEDRPTAILAHSLIKIQGDHALAVSRQYYVGHSFNSSHMCLWLTPYLDGSLLYFVESSSTDRVVGVASALRHAIARQQLEQQMSGQMEKLAEDLHVAHNR